MLKNRSFNYYFSQHISRSPTSQPPLLVEQFATHKPVRQVFLPTLRICSVFLALLCPYEYIISVETRVRVFNTEFPFI